MTETASTYQITCPSCKTANRIPAARAGQVGKCGNCHRTLPPLYLQPLHLTDRSFDAFIASYDGPVLAEFWAPW